MLKLAQLLWEHRDISTIGRKVVALQREHPKAASFFGGVANVFRPDPVEQSPLYKKLVADFPIADFFSKELGRCEHPPSEYSDAAYLPNEIVTSSAQVRFEFLGDFTSWLMATRCKQLPKEICSQFFYLWELGLGSDWPACQKWSSGEIDLLLNTWVDLELEYAQRKRDGAAVVYEDRCNACIIRALLILNFKGMLNEKYMTFLLPIVINDVERSFEIAPFFKIVLQLWIDANELGYLDNIYDKIKDNNALIVPLALLVSDKFRLDQRSDQDKKDCLERFLSSGKSVFLSVIDVIHELESFYKERPAFDQREEVWYGGEFFVHVRKLLNAACIEYAPVILTAVRAVKELVRRNIIVGDNVRSLVHLFFDHPVLASILAMEVRRIAGQQPDSANAGVADSSVAAEKKSHYPNVTLAEWHELDVFLASMLS